MIYKRLQSELVGTPHLSLELGWKSSDGKSTYSENVIILKYKRITKRGGWFSKEEYKSGFYDYEVYGKYGKVYFRNRSVHMTLLGFDGADPIYRNDGETINFESSDFEELLEDIAKHYAYWESQ